ncbi:MAG TPA: hypothetical protein VGQ16_00495 [Vicinamibacterales bacterium]|nr:hypothetical protein [Vicinamibacterales bacterium]
MTRRRLSAHLLQRRARRIGLAVRRLRVRQVQQREPRGRLGSRGAFEQRDCPPGIAVVQRRNAVG